MLERLNLGLGEFFRYAYGGMVFWGLFWYVERCQFNDLLLSFGDVSFAIVVFSTGVLIYMTYHVLGDLIFFSIIDTVHGMWDAIVWFCARKRFKTCNKALWTSPTGVLRQLGVPLFRRRLAYKVLRRDFFAGKIEERFHFSNAELALMHMTSFNLALFWVYSGFWLNEARPEIRTLFFIFLILGITGDVIQRQIEGDQLRTEGERLRNFLTRRGYIPRARERDEGE